MFKRSKTIRFSVAAFIMGYATLSAAQPLPDSWLNHLALQGKVTFFSGPSKEAHAPFEALIKNARSSVLMEMYHLTDPAVVESMCDAKKRGAEVNVILDGKSLSGTSVKSEAAILTSAGVGVYPSSSQFSISHSKSVVVDHSVGIVSSMNLTEKPEVRRDYAVIVEDPAVIAELESVFQADMINSKSDSSVTPPLSDPNLLWSPVNSASKLHDLISTAKDSISAVAENILDETVIADLIAAKERGLHVRVLSPQCPMGLKPDGNYNSATMLSNHGITVRQMQNPATPQTPYQHGKMMLVDNQRVYIGSINYSFNSIHRAREVGIVIVDASSVSSAGAAFDQDFANATDLSATLPVCGSDF